MSASESRYLFYRPPKYGESQGQDLGDVGHYAPTSAESVHPSCPTVETVMAARENCIEYFLLFIR